MRREHAKEHRPGAMTSVEQQVRERGVVTHRAALVVLQFGALGVVLAASPYKSFELDRFFIPKELVLHVTALLAALLCVWRLRTFVVDRIDTLLAGYAVLSIVSAAAAANRSLSTRAVALTLSGVTIFWTARAIANAGLRRPLLIALVVAVVIGALGGLLQAYGVETEYASLSRAPGGTLGNRNFLAHLCAIGTPILLWCTMTSKRSYGVLFGSLAATLVGAALVLSRSRAAWLAIAVCAALLIIPVRLALKRLGKGGIDVRAERRASLLILAAALGVLGALVLPNHLNWKSDSPYLDSVRGVVDYSSGSGRGRIIQYTNTLHMAAAHPVLGVGPGNWPVYYSHFASRHDPSLSQSEGRPANPWPSSDWMALIAERGVGAALLFTLAFVGLLLTAWRHRQEDEATVEQHLAPFALAAALLTTAIVGAFDAVLLLAAPTLIAWAAFGALAVPGRPRVTCIPSGRARRRWVVIGAAVGALMVTRSAMQMVAMSTSCRWPYALILDRCRTTVRHQSIWQIFRAHGQH